MTALTAYRFQPGELLDAYQRSGRQWKKMGKLLGCSEYTAKRHFETAFPEGPPGETVAGPPEGHDISGVSTLYGPDGSIKAQWIKTKADVERQKSLLHAMAAELAREIPRQKPIPKPRTANKHLLNLYTLTDCHVGALAWDQETGDNWDLSIAERTITECFRMMVESSPPAEQAIVLNLGDFLHFDSLQAVTPTSGHILDSDSRYQKVVEVAVRILRTVVNLALARHQRVTVIHSDSNHDPVGSVWLRTLFAALYEKDPRVAVNTSPKTYLAHRHGKTMIAFHHGHLGKFDRLPGIMAAEYPEIWGTTAKRYAHTGHYHHSRVLENAGMVVEQHPTLAARDAYAARLGLHAIRRVIGITYHDVWGEVGRVTCHPEMAQ